ncbi:uncharacterized protein LOC126992815 [Eriocheir sinensis]|uniref:uncharacterized protein LOC126992815 n=1 Tax=Eriocheir sinensis TaxID=95602 RepID=UPI0021C74800|nr:uncharacterized protein LOC126992815 [Eriocheir sinensis]
MDFAALDGHSPPVAGRSPSSDHGEGCADAPIYGRTSPAIETHESHGVPSIRESLREQGVSAEGAEIIMASWKPGTEKQYRPHIRRWAQFCHRRDIDPVNPTAPEIINFLTETFHRNVGYDSINTARGALSSLGIVVNGCRAGVHPLVIRFMRGVFNLRPTKPRYTETWDVKPVLQKLRTMYPLKNLSLKEVTLKLVMLMALTQAARVQTLHLLVLNGITIGDDFISVPLGGILKQGRPSYNIRRIKFQAYPKDASLCVCETLKCYIKATQEHRQITQLNDIKLFISFIKPHKAVSKDTIARWLRTMLNMSGVNTNTFTAGSVRPAAASKAKAMAVPIECIMAKAGWSRETTFATYYDKHIVTGTDAFQEAVLE